MKLNQRKIGILVSYLQMFINICIGLIYTPILLRLLGQNEYGLFSFAISLIAILAILDFGFGTTVVRYNSKYIATKDKIGENQLHGFFLMMYSFAGVLALLLGFLLATNVETLFSSTFTTEELYKLKLIVVIMTVNISLSFPLSIFSSIITAYERFAFLTIINVITTVLSQLTILLIVYFGYQSVGMAMVSALFSIITKLIIMGYCFKNIVLNFSFKKLETNLLKEIILFSFFIFLNILVEQLYVNTDKIILGSVVGTAEVAVYTVAIIFLTYFIQFSTSINGVFLPEVSKLAVLEKNNDRISELFIKVARIQYLILIFIIGGFALYGKDFINFWAGTGYSDAYYIALIVMVPRLFSLSQNLGIIILQAKNKHMFRSVLYIIIAVVNVLITIPLTMAYGGVGAAIGTSIATIFGQIIIMNWYYYKKIYLDIPAYWREVAGITKVVSWVFIFGFILEIVIQENSLILLIVKIGVYSSVFISVIYKLVLNDFEKNLIKLICGKFPGIRKGG